MKPNSFSKKTGILLIILSTVIWGAALLVPFLPLSGAAKLLTSSFLLILAEILFWIGGIILGKEVMRKYKTYLNPVNWFTSRGNHQASQDGSPPDKTKNSPDPPSQG